MEITDVLFARHLNGGGGGDITVESLSVTENGTYSEEGKAYSPVTVEVAPPEDSYQLKSITTPTSLATFNASAMPMPSLKVSVEAKQDLHGYDHPWVGGAGKNKLEVTATTQTINGVTFTPNSDGTIKVNGTATSHVVYDLYYANVSCPYNGYILSGCPQGGGGTTYDLRVSDVTTTSSTETGTGKTINLTDTGQWSAQIVIRNGVTVNNLVFKPMIRLATETDATFAPYSNICPISGWSEVNVTRCGKNLINPNSWAQGVLSTSDGKTVNSSSYWVYSEDYIKAIPNENITLSLNVNNRSLIYLYDKDKNFTRTAQVAVGARTRNVTLSNNEVYLRFSLNIAGTQEAITPSTASNYEPQAEIGETASTFEPYNGTTTTISLPQTVYGGEVDVVNGVLRITDGYIASYNGETLPSTWISSMDEYAEGTSPTTGAEVCYELANPIIINLTPTLIKSLNGLNNLSVDSGDVIEGEYFKAL